MRASLRTTSRAVWRTWAATLRGTGGVGMCAFNAIFTLCDLDHLPSTPPVSPAFSQSPVSACTHSWASLWYITPYALSKGDNVSDALSARRARQSVCSGCGGDATHDGHVHATKRWMYACCSQRRCAKWQSRARTRATAHPVQRKVQNAWEEAVIDLR